MPKKPGKFFTERQQVRPFSELIDTGLLWLINTSVFHPRGFALAMTIDGDGIDVAGWRLLGDGTEPWMFDEIMDGSFRSVEEFFIKHKHDI